MKNAVIVCAMLLIAVPVLCSSADVSVGEVLTNASVIQLHQLGLGEDVIVGKIQTTAADFDTTVDGLIELKKAGVSDGVIAAMIGASSPAPAPTPVVEAPDHTQNLVVGMRASKVANVSAKFDGLCPNPGIFAETDNGVRELDPTSYTGSKTGGFFKSALTYGIASVKSKAMIQGMTSHNRVDAESFLFCFEETEAGLSYETSGATGPSQFVLVELEQNQKQGARMFVTGKFNAIHGGYAGPPPNYRREFTYDKVAPGVYRVTVRGLSPGEYAFFYTGSAAASAAATYGLVAAGGGGKVFDFSVM